MCQDGSAEFISASYMRRITDARQSPHGHGRDAVTRNSACARHGFYLNTSHFPVQTTPAIFLNILMNGAQGSIQSSLEVDLF